MPNDIKNVWVRSTLIFFYKDHFFWDRLFLKNLWKIEKGGNNVLFALFIGVLAMKLSKLSFKKKRELSILIRSPLILI